MVRLQANVPLGREEYDVLQALTFVEESSVSDLLHPVVASYLQQRRGEPEVKLALDALRRHRENRLSEPNARDGTARGARAGIPNSGTSKA